MAYRVGEFATLTGVTVRALQHYDRLGLLKPSRTQSGHRVYADADKQRVRHILALRAIGMSLQQIAELLDATDTEAWIGKEITLRPDKTNYQGNLVDCLRVDSVLPNQEDGDKNIPF